MTLTQLLPTQKETTPAEVISAATAVSTLTPGAPEALSFCSQLSESLLNEADAQSFPELQALGFWLRPASLKIMLQQHLASDRTPAGVTFQIPPGNVDALFGYTLCISILCGNATIIRLPQTARPVQETLVNLIQKAAETATESVRDRILLVRYGHEDAITRELSSACNARLVWGSDATIAHMQSLKLPATAQEINFGDRFSSSAIKASRYLGANENERRELVRRFANDLYWFDQMACSSPRLLVWIGDAMDIQRAQGEFYTRLVKQAEERNYSYDIGASVAKHSVMYLAFHDLNPESYKIYSPQLTLINLASLENFSPFKAVNYGYGLLVTAKLETLTDLAKYAVPRDQTLTLWGFDEAEVQKLNEKTRGKGFDRMVPVGQALSFDAVWDGVNLFQAMTRPAMSAA